MSGEDALLVSAVAVLLLLAAYCVWAEARR